MRTVVSRSGGTKRSEPRLTRASPRRPTPVPRADAWPRLRRLPPGGTLTVLSRLRAAWPADETGLWDQRRPSRRGRLMPACEGPTLLSSLRGVRVPGHLPSRHGARALRRVRRRSRWVGRRLPGVPGPAGGMEPCPDRSGRQGLGRRGAERVGSALPPPSAGRMSPCSGAVTRSGDGAAAWPVRATRPSLSSFGRLLRAGARDDGARQGHGRGAGRAARPGYRPPGGADDDGAHGQRDGVSEDPVRVLPKHIARSTSRCRRGRCARGWPCLAPPGGGRHSPARGALGRTGRGSGRLGIRGWCRYCLPSYTGRRSR